VSTDSTWMPEESPYDGAGGVIAGGVISCGRSLTVDHSSFRDSRENSLGTPRVFCSTLFPAFRMGEPLAGRG